MRSRSSASCAVQAAPLLWALALPAALPAQAAKSGVRLDPDTKLAFVNARGLWVDYRGRRALKLAPLEGHEHDKDTEMWGILTDSDFQNGAIEVDLSGARRAGYPSDNQSAFKGHIGISFRVHGDSAERIYLRPENSRLDDQLFRNRSIQYESDPDYPFQRLRQESPETYESYVDLEPGAWTHVKITVDGTKARLYVNGATQPCFIVNDLKRGASRGKIAVWARISTDAYFSNLHVVAK